MDSEQQALDNPLPQDEPPVLVQKLQALQIKALEQPAEALPMVLDSASDLCTGLGRILVGRLESTDLPYLIDKVEAAGIMPDDILQNLKRIPGYAQMIAEADDKSLTNEMIFLSMHDLSRVVEWYYSVFMKTAVPKELEEFILMNKGETEPSVVKPETPPPLPGSPQPIQEQAEAPTDIIRNYRVPEYARKLVQLNNEVTTTRNRDSVKGYMTDINRIYDMAGLRDDVGRAIFFLLCSRIVNTKRPLRHKDFLAHVLNWSLSAPARNIRHFPTTEITISTTLDSIFAHLKDRGLLLDNDNGSSGRIIALLGIESVEAKKEKDFYSRLYENLALELEKARKEARYPLPVLSQHSLDFEKEGIEVSRFVTFLDTYRPVSDSKLQSQINTPLIALSYNNSSDDRILILREAYNSLYSIAAMKVIEYFRELMKDKNNIYDIGSPINRINNIIRKNFSGEARDLTWMLSPQRINTRDLWTERDSALPYWIFIFRDLVDGVMPTLKHSVPSERSIIQSSSIIYQYIMYNRDLQNEKQEKSEFRDKLVKAISQRDKVPKSFIQDEWMKKFLGGRTQNEDLVKDEFFQFLGEFLEEYSLKRSPNNFLISLPLIDPRTRQMEDFYSHTNSLLDLYKKNLDLIIDKEFGVKQRGFIKRLTAVMENNVWMNDTNTIIKALDTDENFLTYLIDYIKLYYNELFVIDQIFESNNELLRYLVKIKNENANKFFNKDKTKKNLMRFLNLSRLDILKQLKTKNSLFSRIMDFILSLIPFFRKKLGARQELNRIINRQIKGFKGVDMIHNKEEGWEGIQNGAEAGNKPGVKANDILNKLFTTQKQSPFSPAGGSRSTPGQSTPRRQPGGMQADIEKRMHMKVGQFKKALLQEEGMGNDGEYLQYYLKKWSMHPNDDPQIVRQILTRKDANQTLSWLLTIRKDIDKMDSLDDYMEAMNEVARAVMKSYGKSHLNARTLTNYLAMFILTELDKS